ncbi:MAG TPA: abortive infection family protein, partial [Gemmataceae bacterium]|nr:abortive infection family protein [Gemmataceae bacterium]
MRSAQAEYEAMQDIEEVSDMTVTEVTRRAIFDALIVEGIAWFGDMPDDDFLTRMFDLTKLPSTDGRFTNAAGDIFKHRINNLDWDDQWVFHDSRFNLMWGSDDVFLRFLCETVHPVVRGNRTQAAAMVELYNTHLKIDGWELAERMSISGRAVYSARRLVAGATLALNAARHVAKVLDADYISQQITRLEAASVHDPELAIGTGKEFVETVCKAILEERSVQYERSWDFPKLVRSTLKEMKLVPDEVPDHNKAADSIRLLLNNLATISNALAEIRGHLGTGHGKSVKMKG